MTDVLKDKIEYPLNLKFKIGTLSNDLTISDRNERTFAYARQKMFKWKEEIKVYADTTKTETKFTINADRVIDFNSCFAFTNASGVQLGKIGRKGMKSLWKAHYDIFNDQGQQEYHITEENPMAKVFDALLGEVPIVGMLTGYLFNPKYLVKNNDGQDVIRLSKKPSFFGRKFSIDKLQDFEVKDENNILLSLIMMTLLERRRG